MEEWFRDEFFEELHRIDGRETSTCNDCKEDPGLYHCTYPRLHRNSKDQQQRKFGDDGMKGNGSLTSSIGSGGPAISKCCYAVTVTKSDTCVAFRHTDSVPQIVEVFYSVYL